MYALVRSLLFALDPHASHALATAALAPLEHVGFLRSWVRALVGRAGPSLSVRALGLEFPSPIGLAGGFDKTAKVPRAWSALGFGFVEFGTVTAQAQEENPRPNLFRLPRDRALINRLGFPNPGAHVVAARLARVRASGGVGVPCAVSIGKSRVVAVDSMTNVIDDYVASFRAVRAVADFVVINVSSPNTKDLRAIQGAEHARVLLSALMDERAKGAYVPLLLKIAPDLDAASLEALLAVVSEVDLDGIVATNTTVARDHLVTDAARVAAIGAGGLSGPPLRRVALASVRRARAALGKTKTIIGVGGIESAADVLAYLEQGADLVQAYTGFVYGGPLWLRALHRDLRHHLQTRNMHQLSDVPRPNGSSC